MKIKYLSLLPPDKLVSIIRCGSYTIYGRNLVRTFPVTITKMSIKKLVKKFSTSYDGTVGVVTG